MVGGGNNRETCRISEPRATCIGSRVRLDPVEWREHNCRTLTATLTEPDEASRGLGEGACDAWVRAVGGEERAADEPHLAQRALTGGGMLPPPDPTTVPLFNDAVPRSELPTLKPN